MIQRLLSILLLICLACSFAFAEETDARPELTTAGMELGIHSIAYPQLTGLADEALQEKLNSGIISAGQVDTLLAKLPLFLSGEVAMTLSWTGGICGDLLSVAMLADGPVGEDGRVTQVWSTFTADLMTGETLPLSAIFADEESGTALLERYLQETVLPALSPHLENCELLPLPETYTVSSTGLTLYYPLERLSTLSGKAGTVSICWYELAEALDTGESGVPRRCGAEEFLSAGAGTAELIRASVEEGRLPGIPAALGDAMQELVETSGLLNDPDLCEAGRLVALEGAAWRDVFLITDSLQEKTWTGSTVNGIRADRISLWGIATGVTGADEWREILGTPDATVTVDEEQAERWRIEPGTSDYYTFGSHQLRLHAGEDGVLVSVFLM